MKSCIGGGHELIPEVHVFASRTSLSAEESSCEFVSLKAEVKIEKAKYAALSLID